MRMNQSEQVTNLTIVRSLPLAKIIWWYLIKSEADLTIDGFAKKVYGSYKENKYLNEFTRIID